MPDVRKARCHAAHSELHAIFVQPLSYVQPNIADVTVTHLLFDNGVRAHIHVSWAASL
jgi:hypothetical protein